MRTAIRIAAVLLAANTLSAQTIGPEITSWILNTTGETGYDGILTNVQKVEYSADNVYVSCTCIPGYDIGPWQGNPNQPANQNFVFKITRSPQVDTGAPVATPLGHIGVWTNGVSIFNAKDARSYNNRNVWFQDAIVVEGRSFDDCLDHPAPNGEYHHHLNPTCLYDDRDSSRHSPIIGYAFDGFPIYGAFGFRSSDGTGGVTRMRSSYRLRSITERTTLPDGTTLDPQQQGPAISTQYPLGYFIEDYEYIPSLGDLDEHNGRFSITPEYPEGTYAYFVTIDPSGEAIYPYIVGPEYKGVVPPGNTGPGSGHNVPTEPVTRYTLSGVEALEGAGWGFHPNPATGSIAVTAPEAGGVWRIALSDLLGREAYHLGEVEMGATVAISLDGVAGGSYFMTLSSSEGRHTTRLVVMRP